MSREQAAGMSVEFGCGYCGRRLGADSRSAGAKLRCPGCGQLVEVPPASDILGQKEQSGPPAYRPGPKIPVGLEQADGPGQPEEPQEPSSQADLAIRFPKWPLPDDRIDMTPMIDCVFLLLIFYVVTATFAYQKALEIPPPERDSAAPAKRLEEILESEDYIIIRVDKESVLWVNESEVRTRQDLLAKLRTALQKPDNQTAPRPSQLMVLADPDARHEAVVMAIDAGNALGMESIRLATVPEEEF